MENILCQQLYTLKKKDLETYNALMNLLDFVYQDIKENLFEKKIDELAYLQDVAQYSSHDKEIYKKKLAILNNLKQELFYKEDILLESLIAICNNPNQRFKTKLFESIDVPITMLRKGIVNETKSYLYMYNLYFMLEAYQHHKDNYENFEAVVDDLAFNFIPNMTFETEKVNNDVMVGLINGIIDNKRYAQTENLRKLLNSMVDELGKPMPEEEIKPFYDMFAMYQNLFNDLEFLQRIHPEISEDALNNICHDISFVGREENIQPVFYSPILLLGNRYEYIKDKINTIETCDDFKDEIFDWISSLDFELFELLNENEEEDFFIKCMDIVFDSDSYQELISKLKFLQEAGTKVRNDHSFLFNVIKNLNSNKHYLIVSGVEVKWDNTNNKIDKPKRIVDRMIKIYQKNGWLPKKPECLQLYEKNNNLIGIGYFLQHLKNEANAYQKPENELTKKVKKKGLFTRNN